MTEQEALEVAVAWLARQPRQDDSKRELERPIRLAFPPNTWTVPVFHFSPEGEPIENASILTIHDPTRTVEVLVVPCGRDWWSFRGPADVEGAARHRAGGGIRMTEEEARAAAEELLRTTSRDERFRYELERPRLAPVFFYYWIVVVKWIWEDDGPMDGGSVILVDDASGIAEELQGP